MIRFIDLTGQIFVHEEEPHFSFYDTVTNEFKSFSGENTWNTKEEFIKDYKSNELDRYVNKIPEDFFDRKPINDFFKILDKGDTIIFNISGGLSTLVSEQQEIINAIKKIETHTKKNVVVNIDSHPLSLGKIGT